MSLQDTQKTEEKSHCYILSFDGGGSKGVIELVLLKKVFDYASILKHKPEIFSWVFVKGKADEDTVKERLGGDSDVLKVMPVRRYFEKVPQTGHFFSRFWPWASHEAPDADNRYVVAMKSIFHKIQALESEPDDILIVDFASFWIDYWYLVKSNHQTEHNEFWSSKGLSELGVTAFHEIDFDDEKILIMPIFEIDSPAESRNTFRDLIKDLEGRIPVQKFIDLVHPCEIFDIVAGTSTGAIISLGLIGGKQEGNSQSRAGTQEPLVERMSAIKHLPMSLEECILMYQKVADKIFTGTWGNWVRNKLGMASLLSTNYIYTQDSLEVILKDQFGADTLLSELMNEDADKKPIAAAVARKVSQYKDELVVFDTISEECKLTPVVSALLASADAPIYFKSPVKIGESSFVDGGVGGNCPIKQVLPLAQKRFSSVEYVLSVAPPIEQKRIPSSGFSWLTYFVDLTTNGEIEYNSLKNFQPNTHFFRLYPNLEIISKQKTRFKRFHEFKLDTTDVTEMINITEDWLNLGLPLAFSLMSVPPILKRIFNSSDESSQERINIAIELCKISGRYIYRRRSELGLLKAREQLQRFFYWIRDYCGDISPVCAELNFLVGECFREEKQFQYALHHLNKALDIMSKLHGDSISKKVALCHDGIGLCFLDRGLYKDALEHHKQAWKIMKKRYELPTEGKTYPHEYASVNCHYGECLYYQQRYDKALKHFQISANIFYQLQAVTDVAIEHNHIGLCYQELHRYDEAFNQHQKALETYKRIFEETHSQEGIAVTYNNIGCCFLRQNKDPKKAMDFLRKALKARRAIDGANPSELLAEIFENIAECHRVLQEYTDALMFYQESLKVLKKVHGGDNSILAVRCLRNIGKCLNKIERFEEGRKYALRSENMRKAIGLEIKVNDEAGITRVRSHDRQVSLE